MLAVVFRQIPVIFAINPNGKWCLANATGQFTVKNISAWYHDNDSNFMEMHSACTMASSASLDSLSWKSYQSRLYLYIVWSCTWCPRKMISILAASNP